MKKIYLALGLTAILLLNAGCGGSEGTGGIGGDARPETMQEQALHDDSVSVEYINALINGIEYAENMHMIKQLCSPYGENFSEDAAAWAVAHMSDIDWKANALATAKTYRNDMHMSRNEVYEQLTSDAGENFTKEEADYAVAHMDDPDNAENSEEIGRASCRERV